MHSKLKEYKIIIEFIAKTMGDNCEVILHDISNPDHSIIDIFNGHISGRKIGGPMTDLALKLVSDKKFLDHDYMANYKSTTRNGKLLRSSVYFIKDENRKLIGLICINVDVSSLSKVQEILDNYLPLHSKESSSHSFNEDNDDISENLEHNPTKVLKLLIEEGNEELGFYSFKNMNEKLKAVRKWDEKGVFMLKGGVSEVADILGVSEPTVYRYLKMIKKKVNNKNGF